MTSSHPGPPDDLDVPLELAPGDWRPREVYYLLTGLVIPRPIAWVSTLSPEGTRNLAPHSYFQLVAHDPPHVIFSSIGVKDSLANIRATGELVVNLTSADLLERLNFTATDFPPGEDEFDWAELDAAPSAVVGPPRVAEARAHLECRLVEEVAAGNGNVVVAEVVHVHVDPSVWRHGRVDPELLDPVGRLAGSAYARLGEIVKLPRPGWTDVEGSTGLETMPRLPAPDL